MPLSHILDFMLPPRCPGCSTIVETDHRFCATCWSAMQFLGDDGCEHCGRPLGPLEGLKCASCLADPPAYDAVIAAVAYGPVSSRIVLRLKYARRPGLARTIAAILARRLPLEARALLVPVPLHRWRLWSRGFNQSLAIGKALSRATALACDGTLLARKRATPSLRGLNPSQRRRAVKGVFSSKRRLDGEHVLLVDDVLTTGATANACAKALKRAGASRVTLVCWARVLSDD